ncbi:MAG: 4-(cytidine 5'-diphospho)-2-C-methyl-D-erythritol kinase [Fimbriimonadaceae bacterium]
MILTVHCPAKVNLFLSVGPRDASGYHPVRTIMQAVGLYDTLTISTNTQQTQIRSNWVDLPENNTVAKALRLASEVVPLPPMDIHIEKRIPAGSGLGGGSSDAAGLMRALQVLWPQKIRPLTYFGIAVAIGVDVPFFLLGGLGRAEGYGERLTALPDPAEEWIVIGMPEAVSPTKQAYAALDLQEYDWREFPMEDELHNDFLLVAPEESHRMIGQLIESGARDAGLTGSGSAVFGRFHSQEMAAQARDRLRESACNQAWTARTLTREDSLKVTTAP